MCNSSSHNLTDAWSKWQTLQLDLKVVMTSFSETVFKPQETMDIPVCKKHEKSISAETIQIATTVLEAAILVLLPELAKMDAGSPVRARMAPPPAAAAPIFRALIRFSLGESSFLPSPFFSGACQDLSCLHAVPSLTDCKSKGSISSCDLLSSGLLWGEKCCL